MMGKIKNFFSNVVTLVLLLALGIGAFLFLNSHSQTGELTAQSPNAKLTRTPIAQKPSPTPTPFIPEDDLPEPTWTPAVIQWTGTPPPLPSPPPTLTPTPTNPSESVLISFEVPAGLGEISPDGKTLAFNLLHVETKGNPYSQVWLLDLTSKQTTKLVEVGRVGTNQVWSPDGQKLAYQRFSSNGLEEVSIIGIDKKNERSLLKNEDLLGYYWIDSEKVGLIRANSIDEVDSAGRISKKRTVKLPTGNADPNNFKPKPKVGGFNQDTVVVLEDGKLRVISQNSQVTIEDSQGWQIDDFELAPNDKLIAYTTNYGPEEALWVSDLAGDNKRKIFERVGEERGHIGPLTWSPDSKQIVLGWSKPGTSQYLNLVWIDVESTRVASLEVDNVDFSGLVFSPDGQYLYYARSVEIPSSFWGKSTFYQLKVK